jgi:hypothetical protein
LGFVLSSALSLLLLGESQVSDSLMTYAGQAASSIDSGQPSTKRLGKGSGDNRVIAFVRSRLKSNEQWGSLKAGYFCGPMENLRWARGPIQIDLERLKESVLEALSDQEVLVITEGTAPYVTPRIVITATISTAEAHLCSANQSFGNSDRIKGKVTLGIDWQVSDLLSGVPLITKYAEGTAEIPKFNKAGPDPLFEEAILMSLRLALLDGEMLALIKGHQGE